MHYDIYCTVFWQSRTIGYVIKDFFSVMEERMFLCVMTTSMSVYLWRVVQVYRVVQLVVDKAQQSGVELYKCLHHPVVHVPGRL